MEVTWITAVTRIIQLFGKFGFPHWLDLLEANWESHKSWSCNSRICICCKYMLDCQAPFCLIAPKFVKRFCSSVFKCCVFCNWDIKYILHTNYGSLGTKEDNLIWYGRKLRSRNSGFWLQFIICSKGFSSLMWHCWIRGSTGEFGGIKWTVANSAIDLFSCTV